MARGRATRAAGAPGKPQPSRQGKINSPVARPKDTDLPEIEIQRPARASDGTTP